MRDKDDTSESDAALADRARGDPTAFADLYRRYLDRVYAYCRYRLATREQAEDATSQIFLHALAALPNRRASGSFRAWLFTIAHNIVMDCYRKRELVPLTENVNVPARTSSPEMLAVEHDQILRLLGRLPDQQRSILELRLAGLTGAEIAQTLGKSLGAVKMAQHRALARLHADLAATELPCPEPEATPHVHAR